MIYNLLELDCLYTINCLKKNKPDISIELKIRLQIE